MVGDVGMLLDLARSLADGAGALLLDGWSHRRVEVATKSSPTDMVSEMDRAAEAFVVDGIRRHRPSDAVLGEEGADEEGTTGVRWVLDPLDGTTNYLYGLPAWAVSVAVEVDGVAEVGVVAAPALGERFEAVRGRGATVVSTPSPRSRASRPATGPRRLTVRPPGPLAEALVGTGFSYEAGRRARQAAVLASVLPAVRDVRRVGAAALDLCWVGAGRLDASYEKGLQPWDLAAGALVASEAGASLGDLDGGPPSPTFTLAATPTLFEPLRALLRQAGAGDA